MKIKCTWVVGERSLFVWKRRSSRTSVLPEEQASSIGSMGYCEGGELEKKGEK